MAQIGYRIYGFNGATNPILSQIKYFLSEAETIDNHQYIVVEGPIGVGKTSLAKRIADSFGMTVVLEQPGENPFLRRFYNDPEQYALQTQLFFLFQRVQQLKKLNQGDLFSCGYVVDYIFDKDLLFAQLTLGDDELFLYEQVFPHVSVEVPVPDLVIYLQASTEVLAHRIRKRGILFERNMEIGYLESLVEAYARYFYSYQNSPLLMVNAENINFLENQQHYEMLLEEIQQIHSGKHYFNPAI